ncbi:hypothetical protein A4R29_31505 (plasmid) [Mesorhizobium ciceri biovar biserrulae]|nr:hypothetical protein A4R29_31505 [Mesorhizobium ciceri biovar biserrulae]
MRCVKDAPRRAPEHRVVEKTQQLWIVGKPFAEQLETTQNRHQQIVEIVGDAARQFADRIHFLGVEKGLTGLIQGLLRLLPLRNVACDLREPQEFAILVPNGVDDHVGPERSAVFAYTPAFALNSPFTGGDLQGTLRTAPLTVLESIELRKVPADYFICRITLDAFRTRIMR